LSQIQNPQREIFKVFFSLLLVIKHIQAILLTKLRFLSH
jgi:hypothetical protein